MEYKGYRGKWFLSPDPLEDGHIGLNYYDPYAKQRHDHFALVVVKMHREPVSEELLATAKLIAMCPQLLSALEFILEKNPDNHSQEFMAAREVLNDLVGGEDGQEQLFSDSNV